MVNKDDKLFQLKSSCLQVKVNSQWWDKSEVNMNGEDVVEDVDDYDDCNGNNNLNG